MCRRCLSNRPRLPSCRWTLQAPQEGTHSSTAKTDFTTVLTASILGGRGVCAVRCDVRAFNLARGTLLSTRWQGRHHLGAPPLARVTTWDARVWHRHGMQRTLIFEIHAHHSCLCTAE